MAHLDGLSRTAANHLICERRSEETGEDLFSEGMKGMTKHLRPGGPTLDQITQIAVLRILEELEVVDRQEQGLFCTDLWVWLRKMISLATTDAVYGPGNPFRQPGIEQAFWSVRDFITDASDSEKIILVSSRAFGTKLTLFNCRDFSADVMKLFPGIFQSTIAPKGYQGREKLVASFKTYYTERQYESGSLLVQEWARSLERHGLEREDQARSECTRLIALMSNTVPTAFWTFFNVFSDPGVLAKVRREAEDALFTSSDVNLSAGGAGAERFSAIRIRKNMPFLTSVLYESMRHASSGALNRSVLEDVTLLNKYRLKKGGLIIMPNRSVHFNPDQWGPSVYERNFSRFNDNLSSSDDKNDTKSRGVAAFQGFGAGAPMCPGRFFASAEVLAIVGAAAVRCNVRSCDGTWKTPKVHVSNMSLSVAPPLEAKIVEISKRYP